MTHSRSGPRCNRVHGTSAAPRWLAQLLAVQLLLLGIAGCGDDKHATKQDEPGTVAATSALHLQVISTLGEPVSLADATMRPMVGGVARAALASGKSNADGMLALEQVPASVRFAVTVEHPDYATGLVMLESAPGGAVSEQTATLVRRDPAQRASADEQITLRGRDGISVSVPARSFVTAAGEPVSGEIEAYLTPLDISQEAGIAAFPGEFRGVLDDGTEAPMIISQGVAEFRFVQDGRPLQLAAGATAIIEIPIYAEAHADGTAIAAGDAIALWNLDTTTGGWQQHGEGVVVVSNVSKTGLALRAEVGHFSWWNADEFAVPGAISVRVNVFDERGNVVGGSADRALLVATATGYRQADKMVPINTRVDNLPVPANVTLCVHAEMSISTATASAVTASSNTLCTIIQPNQSRHLELNLQIPVFSVAQSGPATATVGAPIGACGTPARIKAIGGVVPIQYVLKDGALPAGLAFSAVSGYIWGTPTGVGPFDPNPSDALFEATDDLDRRATGRVHVRVYDAMELNAVLAVPVLKATEAHSLAGLFVPSGGLAPYRYRLAADGALPPGMLIDRGNGTIFGTPQVITVGNETLTHYVTDVRVQVEDANCASGTVAFRLPVIYAPKLSGRPLDAMARTPFAFTPANTGAVVEEWRVESVLPSWLRFDAASGALSGTPSDADVDDDLRIVIAARNNLSLGPQLVGESRLELNLKVLPRAPAITLPSTSITVAAGELLDVTPTNTGGIADSWYMTNRPAWLALDSATGRMTGMPLAVATYGDISIAAANVSGISTIPGITITVLPTALAPVLAGTPPQGVVDTAYSFAITNSGGVATNWSVSGTLPPGLKFASGVLSGTPSAAGTFPGITVTASNTAGSSSLSFGITIDKRPPTLTFATSGPITRVEGSPAISNPATSDSSGAISYLSSDAAVASVDDGGTVTIGTVGTATITARVAEDSRFLAGSAAYIVQVLGKAITFTITPPPEVIAGVSFSFAPVVTNGLVEQWALSEAPEWVAIHATSGAVSGKAPADASGVYAFSVLASNAGGGSASQAVSLDVRPGAPLLSGTPPVKVGFGFPYYFQPDNLGGEATSWTIENVPHWAAFDSSSGVLHGTPEEADQGLYEDIVIIASNAVGESRLGPFSILVTMQPPVLGYGYDFTQFAYPWTPYTVQPLNDGGVEDIWQIAVDGVPGALPPWLSFDEATGKLQGTPPLSAVGQYFKSVVISATNAGGTGRLEFQLLVKVEPPLLKVEGGDNRIFMAWAPAKGNVLRHDVVVRDRDGNLALPRIVDVAPNSNPLVVDGVATGREYRVQVLALFDDDGVMRELPSREEIVVPWPFNDTGTTGCNFYNTYAGYACPNPNFPAQDGEIGKSKTYGDVGQLTVGPWESGWCAYEPVTGLHWEIAGYGTDPHFRQTFTYAEAVALAATRNASGYCGRSDWRLPTLQELFGVMDLSQIGLQSSSFVSFVNDQHFQHWTATPGGSDPSRPWWVDFGRYGSRFGPGNPTDSHSVMLVAGATVAPLLVDNGDGTVSDSTSGLTWKKCAEGQVYDTASGRCLGTATQFSWGEALRHARTVREGEGKTGADAWRVPNIKELARLIEHGAGSAPMIDEGRFPDTLAVPYWTSTPSSTYSSSIVKYEGYSAHTVDFGTGTTSTASIGPHVLRLVRGGVSPRQWYPDADGDGYGAPGVPIIAVIPPSGYVDVRRTTDYTVAFYFDCDDGNANVNPFRDEVLNDGKDNNCNGLIDELINP